MLGPVLLFAALAASPEPGGEEGDEDSFQTVVRGERPSTEELREGELDEVPGTMEDPIRAVLAMPGVSTIHSGVSYPVVRGLGPGSTALFIDVLNATLSTEVVGYEYEPGLVRRPTGVPRVLPIIGLKGSY